MGAAMGNPRVGIINDPEASLPNYVLRNNKRTKALQEPARRAATLDQASTSTDFSGNAAGGREQLWQNRAHSVFWAGTAVPAWAFCPA